MTIRTKLTLWYSGLVALIIIIQSFTVITVSRVSILTTIDQVLQHTATEVRQSINIMPMGDFGSFTNRVIVGSDEIFSAPGTSIQVWQTNDGMGVVNPTLLRASADLRGMDHALDPQAIHSAEAHFSNTLINGVAGRVVTRPFYNSIGNVQIGVIQVASPIHAIEHANSTLLGITIIAATISILISIGLSMWLSKRALKPIEKITAAAASIAEAEDLSTRLSWKGPVDELGRLTNVFNHMMERLEHLFSVQQRFVGDVSHELRTPLTSILGNLEIMDRYGVDKASLEAVHREADRMSRMVNDLLLLARADYGEMKVDFYPLDLDAVALEVYEMSHILAEKRKLRIKLGRFEPVRIHGNTDRLKQLLLNLTSNAIKFTEDGGSITLSVYEDKGNAVLEVEDTGIGISEEDLRRIFDRFFQADNSRVHLSEADGAGLGLSIARWIVDIHHASINVTSKVGEGTRFVIRFPLLSSNGKDVEGLRRRRDSYQSFGNSEKR